MSYRPHLILLFLSLAGGLHAQEGFHEKKQLYDLLTQRKEKFGQYLQSLEKKSGLFGSKSKNDLRGTVSVLKEIVETDNKIIGVLNRAIDFKAFEKTRMNYDMLDRDRQVETLRKNATAMEKRMQIMQEKLASGSRTIRLLWILLALVVAVFAAVQYYQFRKS